jgi:hypothetical protein
MRSFLFNLWENLIYILVGVLVLNVLVLDYFVFIKKPNNIVQNIKLGDTFTIPASQSSQTVQVVPVTQGNDMCPNTCLAAIKTATESLNLTQEIVNNTTTNQTVSGGAQEFFIPFGSASGASQSTYTTLGALQSYVNISQYSGVQTITFEVSMTIPNGNQMASAQLYNATDGYAIANSQVTMSGGTPQLLISPNITLPSGNKLYQVQINTQLNSPINIDQARLHITTN